NPPWIGELASTSGVWVHAKEIGRGNVIWNPPARHHCSAAEKRKTTILLLGLPDCLPSCWCRPIHEVSPFFVRFSFFAFTFSRMTLDTFSSHLTSFPSSSTSTVAKNIGAPFAGFARGFMSLASMMNRTASVSQLTRPANCSVARRNGNLRQQFTAADSFLDFLAIVQNPRKRGCTFARPGAHRLAQGLVPHFSKKFFIFRSTP